jgi:parvulin-like peptidyl-prolyl isomerase
MPIRRHLGDESIEQAAFALKPGEVSDVIPAAGQYVILKCEDVRPSRMDTYKLEGGVKEQLERTLREKKERVAASEVFEELRKNARVVKCLGDKENSARYPGVAAIVNNRTLTLNELAEECIRRHGVEVLEGTISRVILDQYCNQEEIRVSEQDIDDEIARAAEAMGYVDANSGQADISAWLKNVEMEQGLSLDLYVDEVVWRTVALKQYIHKKRPKAVRITDEDLQKGFEANFGPRVRCKAIVLNNQRTADEVWKMAREKPNALYFGQLAAKYSIEPGGASLNGDVPPIQKHGGRPLLEEEAFKLKEGEMSGVIQVDTNFVILFCTGYTEPVVVDFEDVKEEIHRDLYEKKLRVEMAKVYDAMLEASKYENLLAGTWQRPKQAKGDGNVQPASGEETRR